MPDSFRELPPVSARRAIALAFDLARRDPMHSLVVPMLLRAPWILAIGLLTPGDDESPRRALMLGSVALLGDYAALTITSAMLRFRALSVWEAPPGAPPAPALACYARGLRRVLWLVVTEFVRYAAAVFGLFFLVRPGGVLGFPPRSRGGAAPPPRAAPLGRLRALLPPLEAPLRALARAEHRFGAAGDRGVVRDRGAHALRLGPGAGLVV